MNECEIDVSVGETLCLGEINVTILGIENGEIHFRIESAEDAEESGSILEEEAYR